MPLVRGVHYRTAATRVLSAVKRCGRRAFYEQRRLSRAEAHSRGLCPPARKQTSDAREGGETFMTRTGHFADRLCAAVERKGNAVVVGLDPRLESLPED